MAVSDPLRILVAVPPPWFEQFLGDQALSKLSSMFNDVVRVDPSSISAERWITHFSQFRPNAVLSAWGTPSIPISARPDLGFVSHAAGEIRRLVDRKLIEDGLLVSNWGELAAPSVAECALMLILCSLRGVTHWSLMMHRDRGWPSEDPAPNVTLVGKRVGIHGFGKIAQALVRLLQPFNCRISAYSAGVPSEVFASHGVRQADSLGELFGNSDVLVEAEALTPATRQSIDESLLRRLAPGSVFVNVGRGAVVQETALIKIAQEGKIQIALDVYETEPLPASNPLRGLTNVTLMPHIGGPTLDRRRDCGQRAIDNLQRFARGEKPLGLVTLDVYDRST